MTDTGALEMYRAEVVLQPSQVRSLQSQVSALKSEQMVNGVDFGVIPGTPKPSLWKPGAEKLLAMFGLTQGEPLLEYERDAESGRPWRVTVTVPVRSGSWVVAVGVGSADYLEAGFQRRQGAPAPWNTLLKMAKKRALVDAVLTATNSSGTFTQDVEDDMGGAEAVCQWARRYVRASPGWAQQVLRKETSPPDQWGPQEWLTAVWRLGQIMKDGEPMTETGDALPPCETTGDDDELTPSQAEEVAENESV